MTLQAIQARLRRGTHPSDLPRARIIGQGSTRVAYCVGRYIVKKYYSLGTFREKHYLPKGVIFSREWVVRNTWVIQPRYRVLTHEQWEKRDSLLLNALYRSVLDLGPQNVGLDKRGRCVAFDW